MARLESRAVGGYFPTPQHLTPRIARLFTATNNVTTIFDPCAGDGEAVFKIAELVASKRVVYACELESSRAKALKRRPGARWDTVLVGDAFRASWSTGSHAGASLLYLNPPYDDDREHGRLEEKFLARFTRALAVGGWLAFVVPHYALRASARTIAANYDEVQCLRFPDDDFAAFKQVVLVGRRVPERLPAFVPNNLVQRLAAWAVDGGGSVLPEDGDGHERVLPGTEAHRAGFHVWKMRHLDVESVMRAAAPWRRTERLGKLAPVPSVEPEEPAQEVLLRRYPLATPPRPAHIAAGIAAGVFNGARVEPDDDSLGLPAILIKGVFEKEFVTIEHKETGTGTKETQVQQPKLAVTVLDLSRGEFRAVQPGTEETGSLDVGNMNLADLIARYGHGLGRVMDEMCPAAYDPRRASDVLRVAVPPSPRRPFTAQAHAVRALTGLLGGQDSTARERKGRAAILLGEIGCLGLGTMVMRANGTLARVEDVRVGDSLMGPDSKPRRVLRTVRGASPLFRVRPVTGESWVCNDEHILTLVHTMSDDVFDVPLAEYVGNRRLKRLLSRGGRTTHPREEFKQFFPEAGVEFPVREAPPIDPYFLGVWYGDGTKNVGKCGLTSVQVTKPDVEVADACRAVAAEFGLVVRTRRDTRHNHCPSYTVSRGRDGKRRNNLLDVLRVVYGDGTTIPECCALGSRDTRLAFLAGFLDTDGYLANNCFEIVQKRRRWADGICFIARSLGIRATMAEKVVNGESYWRIMLSGDLGQIPTRIVRKRAGARPAMMGGKRMKRAARTGIAVESIGDGEYAGFTLDGDGRFLLGDFTVTHNSGKSTVAVLTACALDVRRPLILCPPHLLDSWREQVAAVRPDWRVVVLSSVSDVDAWAATEDRSSVACALLTREAAKLGHALSSVSGRCPKCGARIGDEDHARKRERCTRREAFPTNEVAAEASRLADLLLPYAASAAPYIPDAHGKELRASVHAREGYVPPVYHGLGRGAFAELFGALLRYTGASDWQAVQSLDRARLACLLADYDAEAIADAACFELARDRWSSYHSMTPDLFHLLHPGSAARERVRIAGSEAVKRSTGWNGGYNPFEVKDGEETTPLGDVTWEDGMPVVNKVRANTLAAAMRALECARPFISWTLGEPCGEPLFAAVPEPRRVALARYVAKRAAHAFDFLIADEAHEYGVNGDSAQSLAAHRLIALGHPTLLMTGSIMNGYAESMFANLWSISPKMRAEFSRDEKGRFVDRYGYRKRVVEKKVKAVANARGAVTDRVERSERMTGQSPGVLPLLLLRHLLPVSVTLHKADLALDLPRCTEERHLVQPDAEQRRRYLHLLEVLKSKIKEDMFTERSGKLFGALSELPSYLDRATGDVGNCDGGAYEIRYPESCGSEFVASEEGFASSTIMPKERWMIDTVARELREGRNVMVLAHHVSLVPRLARLLTSHVARAVVLDSAKVPTAKRQAWIEREVVRAGARVLVTNPVCIQTGLNNLVHFATEVWMENPACNPVVYRQAVGRVDRVGQRIPTRILFPIYAGTLQETLHELLLKKVAVSVSTDGLDPESALQAAGAGVDDAYLAGLSVGKRIWAMIEQGYEPRVRGFRRRRTA